MALASGTRLGPYVIAAPIGSGGMGEVYKATDPRLGRDVAIKVVPAAFSADPERLSRFEQEARAAAALNHPNILAVHDIGQADGSPYIVSELLEGETLRERLNAGALPVRKAVEYAVQIGHGLAAAHAKGITHRDLKPENLFVTIDGHVKVLDFGLAKLTEAAHVLAGVSQLPTLSPPTTPGMVLGTVGYMAPEQVRGETADHRADIFALGTILYEMLAGRRAFQAGTSAETMTAILNADPRELSSERLSPALGRIVNRCLEKQPGGRFQTATDLAFALESLSASAPSSAAEVATRHAVRVATRERVAWAVAVVAVMFAGTGLWRSMPSSTPPPLVTRFEVVAPPSDSPASLAVSPDGRLLVYAGTTGEQSRLFVRPLDSNEARALLGTDGATFPFWAPDSNAVGFFADGKLKRVDLTGGTPQVLADAPNGRGGAWSTQGVILFTPGNLAFQPDSVVMSVPAGGGTVAAITQFAPGDGSHRWPQFLPDGRRFIFFNTLGRPDKQGIYIGSLDGGEPKLVIASESPGVFAPPDHLIFARGNTLMAVHFDLNEGTVTGDPQPLAQPVGRDEGMVATAFSISPRVIVYRTAGGTQRRQLVWMDRAGTVLGSIGSPDDNNLSNVALDPAGQRVAAHRTILGNFDIWVLDANRGVPTRLTFDPAGDIVPLWSPDGRRVIFMSSRNGRFDLFEKSADGAGDEQVVIEDAGVPVSWSQDGRFLVYSRPDPKTGSDLWMVQMNGERKPRPVVQTAGDQFGGDISPDGRWIVYESNESGRFDVYVQRFPDAGGKWQVSVEGGTQARWSRDGRELYFVGFDARVMAAPVRTGADGKTLDLGTPAPLFRPRLASGSGTTTGRAQYAVAPDGRFLVNTVVEDTAASPITVVVNWTEALAKR